MRAQRWLNAFGLAIGCSLAVVIGACSSHDEPTDARPLVVSVTISPGSGTLSLGGTMVFTAAVFNYSGDTTMMWRSNNPQVATVSQGHVTAVGTGTADIIALIAADTAIRASVRVTVIQ